MEEEMNRIKEAAEPLQKILQKYFDPMHIIVTCQGIEIFGCPDGIPAEAIIFP